MPGSLKRLLLPLALGVALAACLSLLFPPPLSVFQTAAEAQSKTPDKRKEQRNRRKRERPAPVAAPAAQPQPKADADAAAAAVREKVEADVSTRSIAVTSGFTGTEIIVFGSVTNSRQPSAESGFYDMAVIVEGAGAPLIARKKSNVGGLWLNTEAASFVSVPSYYAIASTRPLEEIAEPSILGDNEIGLDYARTTPTAETERTLSAAELKDYRAAVVRIKADEGLYITNDYGVAFIGRSLFRSSIELPPNVPVGPLTARVYLFHEGELLSTFQTGVELEREGLELVLYRFATRYSLLYGLFAVFVAGGAGLLASTVFRRPVQ